MTEGLAAKAPLAMTIGYVTARRNDEAVFDKRAGGAGE
jgi:hypothetical protein